MQLEDVHIGESESLTDFELLDQVLDLRERMEECISEAELDEIRTENNGAWLFHLEMWKTYTETRCSELMQDTTMKLSKAFEDNDLDSARELTVQLQYWVNIDKAIKEWVPGGRVEIKH